jgi:hypothetical protein
LQKTLIENEENKRLQAIQKQKQKEDDIMYMAEYSKVVEKQENTRKAYFKNIELKANSFLSKMSATVLKDIDAKNKMDEEKIKQYGIEKEGRLVAKERNKLEQIHHNKISMRHFLDKQVEEKRQQGEFDKYLDDCQAKIWNTDREVVKEQNNIFNRKVSF